MTRVEVTWNDAEDPTDGKTWLDEEELDQFAKHDCSVKSIGYLKSHTDKYVTLVGDWIPELKHHGRPTKIPTGMVVSIVELKE